MSKQIVVFRTSVGPATNATQYCAPLGCGAFGTEAVQSMTSAAAGIFRNLRVVLSASPGTGNSWAITLRVNGAGSALTLTFSNAETDKEITGTDVSVSAGDVLALEFIPTSLPTAMTPSVSLEFDSTTPGASMYGTGCNTAVSVTRNTPLFGGATTTNWLEGSSVNAVEGDFTALYVSLNASPGTGSYAFNIEKNGVLQDGTGGTVNTTVTIATSATTGNASFTLPCSPGDLFRLRCTPSSPGTARQPRYGVCLVADTPGVSNFHNSSIDTTNNAATEYLSAGDFAGSWNATESSRQATAGVAFDLKHVRFSLNGTPGTPRSLTLTLRVNGSDSALTATVSDAATDANGSATVSIVPGDLLSCSMVPTNTPTNRATRWSFSQEIIEARPRSWGAIF